MTASLLLALLSTMLGNATPAKANPFPKAFRPKSWPAASRSNSERTLVESGSASKTWFNRSKRVSLPHTETPFDVVHNEQNELPTETEGQLTGEPAGKKRKNPLHAFKKLRRNKNKNEENVKGKKETPVHLEEEEPARLTEPEDASRSRNTNLDPLSNKLSTASGRNAEETAEETAVLENTTRTEETVDPAVSQPESGSARSSLDAENVDPRIEEERQALAQDQTTESHTSQEKQTWWTRVKRFFQRFFQRLRRNLFGAKSSSPKVVLEGRKMKVVTASQPATVREFENAFPEFKNFWHEEKTEEEIWNLAQAKMAFENAYRPNKEGDSPWGKLLNEEKRVPVLQIIHELEKAVEGTTGVGESYLVDEGGNFLLDKNNNKIIERFMVFNRKGKIWFLNLDELNEPDKLVLAGLNEPARLVLAGPEKYLYGVAGVYIRFLHRRARASAQYSSSAGHR